jgi:hypothetical protein
MCIGSPPCKKIIMYCGKNFRRREWRFSRISGGFTDSMNLAQGCCNDSMKFRTVILNWQYEISTVILKWQYEVSTIILYWENEVSTRFLYWQYDVSTRILYWQYEGSTCRTADSFCYLLRRLIIFNSLRNIIKILKWRRLRWTGHVAHTEGGANNRRSIFVWNCAEETT